MQQVFTVVMLLHRQQMHHKINPFNVLFNNADDC
jgi:hypothetical protein